MSEAVERAWWCEHAWVDGGVRARVAVTTADGVITRVTPDTDAPPHATRLTGLVLPGMANAHSHAFHRALRGRTHDDGGTFWTWRARMYELAARLDPDTYRALATAVYAEMVAAGWTSVAEFHYLHHAPGGRRYTDPNAMGHALRDAAAAAGIRLTLLDTCYLAGGLDVATGAHTPVDGPQTRFSDGTADAWAERAAAVDPGAADGVGPMVVGAAIHSVRAVPAAALPTVARAAAHLRGPLHVHLSEQPVENAACLAAHGRTPTRLLQDAGALGPRTTAVHATHLTVDDIALLGTSGTSVSPCPTTEADLADGIGPLRELADAGCALALGTDQHASVDPFAEARGLESGERLRTLRRGRFTPAELVAALTCHHALGRAPHPAGPQSAGAQTGGPRTGGTPNGDARAGGVGLQVGAPADLVAVRLDSPRTAGADPAQAVLVASAADVRTVVVHGRVVVTDGEHRDLGDVGRLLDRAIRDAWTSGSPG